MYSEVLTLTWPQIDFDAGTLRLLSGSTKNGEGRVIFLAPELQALIERQWAEHQTLYPNCPLVFHRDGKRVKDIRGSWERACKESGLTCKIPRDFRRTAIRNMVWAGISEHVAMKMSGHKTRDVFDRYDLVSESELREAAHKLSERLSGRTMTKAMTITPSDVHQAVLSHQFFTYAGMAELADAVDSKSTAPQRRASSSLAPGILSPSRSA